ncbi:MAG: hypothetical protein HQL54_00320 [Magnetococcales bacterium]|nr:hypothetical protein [Magnetococcales bacterium]
MNALYKASAVLLFVLFVLVYPAQSAPMTESQVPEQLKPWISWVMHGHEQSRCPTPHDNSNQRLCAWPSTLHLTIDQGHATFKQSWQVWFDSVVPLPDGVGSWLENVNVNNKPAILTSNKNKQAIALSAGTWTISGTVRWKNRPEKLWIPPETGVLTLILDGKKIESPLPDRNGRLWLSNQHRIKEKQATQRDTLTMRVFRLIDDDIPMQITTRLMLDISGQNREITIQPPQLAEFTPLALHSPLPARLEPDGRLHIQARPGTWMIRLIHRSQDQTDIIPLTKSDDPNWPKQEIWSFQAQNGLRVVKVIQGQPVDPSQYGTPEQWRTFPAYRIQPGETFAVQQEKRGDSDPLNDQITLNRTIWIDFDGKGLTTQDRLSGMLTRSNRLEMNPTLQLGHANSNGQDLLITERDGSQKRGVPLTLGPLNLVAESRYDGGLTTLPAVGWNSDLSHLSTQLNLPPGWKLLFATGPDQIHTSWIHGWTVLDMFMVLVAAIAIGRLWGWVWGGVSLIGLILISPEDSVIIGLLLNMMVAIALLRVAPEGRLMKIARLYRNLSWVPLILACLMFTVEQARFSLYPQLENNGWGGWMSAHELQFNEAPMMEDMAVATEVAEPMLQMAPAPRIKRAPQKKGRYSRSYGDEIQQYQKAARPKLQQDPDARIQTGPGVPNWQWKRIQFNWNGPVLSSEQITLYLMSPTMNRIAAALRIILLGFILMLFFDMKKGVKTVLKPTGSAASIALILAASLFYSNPLWANSTAFPDQGLLDQLSERLRQPAECYPKCAEAVSLTLHVQPEQLSALWEVHVSHESAVLISGGEGNWNPQKVHVDGKKPHAMRREENGSLQLFLNQGAHTVVLSGPIANHETVRLAVPMKLKHLKLAVMDGWQFINQDQGELKQLDAIVLRRIEPIKNKKQNTDNSFLPFEPPPFFHVERRLILDQTWKIETRVSRVTDAGFSTNVVVPLLEKELVLSQGVKVKQNAVQLHFNAGQREHRWHSSLKQHTPITLHAPKQANWSESWVLMAGPIWHISMDGIPPIFQQDKQRKNDPYWRPWPGETVTIHAERPPGVNGPTMTLQSSVMNVTPGARSLEATLNLTLNSSQGGRHVIVFDEASTLLSAQVNGRSIPLNMEQGRLAFPIIPGNQRVYIQWRQPSNEGMIQETPRVNLNMPGVNTRLSMSVPSDRWLVFLGGPALGPAVLFWGTLMVLMLVAWGLGRTDLTPLKHYQWALLFLGFSTQLSYQSLVIVVGWFMVISVRSRMRTDTVPWWRFGLIQIALVVWTISAVATLFSVVEAGLLGVPQMMVEGNNSTGSLLNWFQDRHAKQMPTAWMVSLPMVAYKGLMLLWALWLANAFIGWTRWAWRCFSHERLWTPMPKLFAKEQQKTEGTEQEHS